MLEPSGLYYPNRIARAFFVAMEDVMGRHGLANLLSIANLTAYIDNPPPSTLDRQFDFAAMAALNEALEVMYGSRGGRGMALRIGRAAFAQGIRHFGVMRGIGDAAFQVLPLQQRLGYGLHGLASLFTRFSDQECTLRSDDNALYFQVEVSPMAWGRHSDKPVCHAMVGIIQECLRWSSNGYEFYVRETTCRASGGDACVFRVNRTAMGDGEQNRPH